MEKVHCDNIGGRRRRVHKAQLQITGSTKLELEFNLVCTLVAQSPQHPNVSRLFFTTMCVFVFF